VVYVDPVPVNFETTDYRICYLNQHNAAVSILTYAGGDRIMRNFMMCSSTDIKWNEMGVACSIHGREVHNRVLLRNFEGKGPLERSGVGERILRGWVFIKKEWNGLILFMVGTSGRAL
jgi:hypothetical protein